MSMSLPARARWWLPALAAGGVLLSHSLAYRLAVPSETSRAALLEASGHHYWTWAVLIAAAGAVAGLASFLVRHFKGLDAPWSPARLYVDTFLKLVLYQGAAFVLLETAERLLSGQGLHGLMSHPMIALGLVIQAGIALVAALVLVLLATAVDRVARLLSSPRRARTSITGRWILTPPPAPRARIASSARSLRGPPLHLRP